MATNSSAIQKKIETLKKGLNNKFITAAQKEKIKAQVQKLESQSKASAPKKATKPAASSSLTRLQKLVKNKKYSVYKGKGVDLKKDSDRPAKAIGKRISKSGKTYYEYRANRIDVKQPPKKYPKLEKGGYMANGGELNLGIRKMAQEEGFTPKELGKDYELIIAQAVVEALTDANYHDAARKLVSLLEKNPKIAIKPNYPSVKDPKFKEKMAEIEKEYGSKYWEADDKTRRFAIKVSQKSGYDGYAIAGAFEYLVRIDGGYHKLADNIEKAMESADEMAEGGMTEHGLRIGDKITTDMFWDNQIVVENTKTNKRAQIDLETGKRKDEMEKGGEVDRERMYNFLKDDLAALEKAIEANNQEEIEKFFSYWNIHLKSLEPKTGSKRMYEFLKDDLVGLEAATKELPSSKEETDRFFSYWNIHLSSLEPKMEKGGYMADGGVTEKEVVESNADMVLSQIKAVKHHAEELSSVVSRKSNIEAWVVGKIERASTDLSDITHYLEGNKDKMSMGGTVRYYAHKMDKK